MAWFHSTSDRPERWSGCCASRDEAIAEGTREYEGEPFYVAEGTQQYGIDFFPDAGDVLEHAALQAGDGCGEAAEEWPDASEAARADLNHKLELIFRVWLAKYDLEPRFEVVEGDPERIEPAKQGGVQDG